MIQKHSEGNTTRNKSAGNWLTCDFAATDTTADIFYDIASEKFKDQLSKESLFENKLRIRF